MIPSSSSQFEPLPGENFQQDLRSIIAEAQDASGSPEQDRWAAIRALDLLNAAGDFSRFLPALAAFVRHADPHVRSKAALLMGRASHTLAWVEHALRDPNDRVRANAVESIWRIPLPAALPLLERALGDASNRVATNAAVGLHFLGQRQGTEALEHMADHHDPLFRASAIWAMGMLGDAAFMPTALRLRNDPDPKVRHLALRCLARLRSGSKAAGESPAEAGP